MPIEIERRFLVSSESWRKAVTRSERHRQGYLSRTAQGSVRVRRTAQGATLAVKGPRRGLARWEFEYPIPPEDADEMLRGLCGKPLIEKVRHWVTHGRETWQVDVYEGAAAGLVVAEIELADPEQAFARPDWLGREVSHDPRYRNSTIALAGPPPAAPGRAALVS